MTDVNAHDLATHGHHMENLIYATCRQAIRHTYCVVIFGTYRFRIWMPYDRPTICHIRVPRDLVT